MKPSRLLPLLFAVLKFISGFVLASRAYELHRDEYLYLDEGRHLAWGYLEVPPLIAAQAWVTQALGGDYFWVKFWPFLWGALTVYLVGRIAQKLGGGWFAVVLACVCYCVSGYARLNFLFQPNSFEVFGFTLCCYWLLSYMQEAKPRYLYYIGLGLGLSLLNKYTTFFFIAALLVALVLTPQRRVLASKHFWLAAALTLVLFSPSLWWQLAHGVPFLHHMSELHDTQLVNVSVAGFWKEQLLMCFPAVWVWVPGLLALFAYGPLRMYRSLGLVYVVGLLILTMLHGKSYYSLGYYPVLFAFGAVWWEQLLQGFRYGALVRPALVLLPVLIILPVVPFIFTLYPPAYMQAISARYQNLGITRWEDGKIHALPQDYADMIGWQELADKTYQAYQALPDSTRAFTLIKCDNYGQASAINYYNRHRDMPLANSFNGSYLFWFPPQPAQPYRHLLLIGEGHPAALVPHFRELRQVGEITNPYAREKGTTILLGTDPDAAILELAQREYREALAVWVKEK
ncbi:glycosyltransferase family 39 protein [Hymenobacter cavernae]|nr:glycosyltransferase family 39 protein [Hymenobacter cavernae]